jgi:hypothetical protein
MKNQTPSWLNKEETSNSQKQGIMSKPSKILSFVAIVTIATLLSTAHRISAAELNRLVVTGIPLDRVASRHASPRYPQDARSLKIQGDVRIRIQVENGKMVNVTAEAGSPLLAAYCSSWVRSNWQFRPSVSGVYFLPIAYKLTA